MLGHLLEGLLEGLLGFGGLVEFADLVFRALGEVGLLEVLLGFISRFGQHGDGVVGIPGTFAALFCEDILGVGILAKGIGQILEVGHEGFLFVLEFLEFGSFGLGILGLFSILGVFLGFFLEFLGFGSQFAGEVGDGGGEVFNEFAGFLGIGRNHP